MQVRGAVDVTTVNKDNDVTTVNKDNVCRIEEILPDG